MIQKWGLNSGLKSSLDMRDQANTDMIHVSKRTTFYHDHISVHVERAEEATLALKKRTEHGGKLNHSQNVSVSLGLEKNVRPVSRIIILSQRCLKTRTSLGGEIYS